MSRQAKLFAAFDTPSDHGYPVLTSLVCAVLLGTSEQVARTELYQLRDAGWIEVAKGRSFGNYKRWTRSEKVGTP